MCVNPFFECGDCHLKQWTVNSVTYYGCKSSSSS